MYDIHVLLYIIVHTHTMYACVYIDGHEPQQSYAHGAGYPGQTYPSPQHESVVSPIQSNKIPPPRSSQAGAVYENCEPAGRKGWGDRTGHQTHSVATTASVSSVTRTLTAVQLGSPQVVAPPPAPTTMMSREVTNAEFPYHTTQQGVSYEHM